jgi:hypothetical protein
MSVGTLLSIAVPGAFMVESLGAIVPPEVPVVGGAAVLPTGGVLFCAGAVYCAAAVVAIAPNDAISKVLRILRRIMI